MQAGKAQMTGDIALGQAILAQMNIMI